MRAVSIIERSKERMYFVLDVPELLARSINKRR